MRTTGTVMIVLGWLMLAGLIFWGFAGFLAPNRHLDSDVSVAGPTLLKRGPDGHYRAPGRINGQSVDFLVDTGATVVAIPAAMAKRLGLKTGLAERVHTANGEAVAYASRLDSLSLGNATATAVAAHVVPGMAGDEALLGMSFLGRFQIRLSNDEMRIEAR